MIADIQDIGMFSVESLVVMAIATFSPLLIILMINGAKILQLNKQSQIQLLEAEVLIWQDKYSELAHKLAQITTEKEALHQEGLRLHQELQQQQLRLTEELRVTTFEQLQTLLTNYPSIHQMVSVKPELPAKNLLSMFTPLDNLLGKWGYELIGKPWEQVPYNSQLHQPDKTDITEGELVYIRFVGYQHQGKILCPAKVSRTLPGGR
ncbi:molecular chaperone GrpE [Nostoc sp. FACHB-87]|uniref:molecular chaperone GrpE n=1 Tax=Nostocaceae TaxID=1162 RepID=UPI0016883AD5|nr:MULTISPECIES: molecular chaperone GrpE [Nostocaceae]MBD2458033.1 molecular chaperone GrpE [Nostoc sp. FACHB-87]MBD2479265.1 molecular chaperone GrpE [Anabaena sp. FACHB-83]